ncbi:TetR/AcrR family transcriptional regulator [Motiliproteus sp.]|uniref:TetR/AcrR family transcriptional regulator n=1 Tax=Motiliproteus sp. TaxID=1898955 RepID=UPI003BAC8E23
MKNKKRGRPSQNQSQLTTELIITTALKLLQENGKVPSIRQISGVLNVDPMAIYHYFSNKTALLEALTVSLVEEIYDPEEGGCWQTELRQLCKTYLALLGAHTGLLETLLTMDSDGPAQIFIQRLATALAPLQLDNAVFNDTRDLLVDYIHGVALAIQCNPENLSIDCIDGPLNLILNGLENS